MVASTPALAEGMSDPRRIAQAAFDRELGDQPGIYYDGDTLRFDVVEILRAKGIEPTPQAIEISARNLQKAAAELGLPSEVTERPIEHPNER
jgi:hypothetical protein